MTSARLASASFYFFFGERIGPPRPTPRPPVHASRAPRCQRCDAQPSGGRVCQDARCARTGSISISPVLLAGARLGCWGAAWAGGPCSVPWMRGVAVSLNRRGALPFVFVEPFPAAWGKGASTFWKWPGDAEIWRRPLRTSCWSRLTPDRRIGWLPGIRLPGAMGMPQPAQRCERAGTRADGLQTMRCGVRRRRHGCLAGDAAPGELARMSETAYVVCSTRELHRNGAPSVSPAMTLHYGASDVCPVSTTTRRDAVSRQLLATCRALVSAEIAARSGGGRNAGALPRPRRQAPQLRARVSVMDAAGRVVRGGRGTSTARAPAQISHDRMQSRS